MSEVIDSPPYPGQATTSQTLYKHLELLRSWIVQQQADLRPRIPDQFAAKIIEPPADLADVGVWSMVGVIDQHSTLRAIQYVREAWDHILRTHEDSWTGKLCLMQRFNLVTFARQVIANSCITAEVMEMRDQSERQKMAEQMRRWSQHVQQVVGAPVGEAFTFADGWD